MNNQLRILNPTAPSSLALETSRHLLPGPPRHQDGERPVKCRREGHHQSKATAQCSIKTASRSRTSHQPRNKHISVISAFFASFLFILPCLQELSKWRTWTQTQQTQVPVEPHQTDPTSNCIRFADSLPHASRLPSQNELDYHGWTFPFMMDCSSPRYIFTRGCFQMGYPQPAAPKHGSTKTW